MIRGTGKEIRNGNKEGEAPEVVEKYLDTLQVIGGDFNLGATSLGGLLANKPVQNFDISFAALMKEINVWEPGHGIQNNKSLWKPMFQFGESLGLCHLNYLKYSLK